MVARDLRRTVGDDLIVDPVPREYLVDATEARGVAGLSDAIVAWCYEHDVPIVPRGGGTGFAGGAVPVDGGVVLRCAAQTGRAPF